VDGLPVSLTTGPPILERELFRDPLPDTGDAEMTNEAVTPKRFDAIMPLILQAGLP
jgi:hypothetical protein